MALDKRKPYGQIYGDSKGRAFEQDGAYFGANGEPWVDPEAPVAPAAGKPKAKAVEPVAPEVPAEVEDQLAKQRS